MKVKQSSPLKRFLAGIFIAMVIVALTSFASAGERKSGMFDFGVSTGFMADTPDSAAFAIGLSGDYYLTSSHPETPNKLKLFNKWRIFYLLSVSRFGTLLIQPNDIVK
jgi:hypothetical protein